MTLTLLLDLDDTLLNTNMDTFIPAYFQALSVQLAPHVEPETMLRALLGATRRMMASEDPSCILQNVFESYFYTKLGVSKEGLAQEIEKFYDEIFPTLQQITAQVEGAKEFVEWAVAQGYRIVIATDPLFPRKAIYHRIRWAGFEPERFELVSSFEHFHFTKSHAAYYAEVLGRIGWPDGPVLMVGNDMERDILPAQRLGLATWHIEAGAASGSGPEAGARGKLEHLPSWLESTDLSTLEPSLKSRESVMAILQASPASLSSLCADVDSSLWQHRPGSDDWGLTELACHLRDTEREIHHMQIKLLTQQAEPFIPRPDTSVWASRRNYQNENGRVALEEFTQARVKTIAFLKDVPVDDWNHRARHAIFGPTNFLEVVGFMADHDRMHIQQAWRTIHPS
ncbi:MAG: DinB family protein [Chloroflexota bacterium]